MSQKGIGAMLVFLGIGAFVLPLFGFQFRIIAIFGDYSWLVSLVAVVIGVLLIAKGKD